MSKANYFQFLQKLLGNLFLISNIKEKQGKIWKKKAGWKSNFTWNTVYSICNLTNIVFYVFLKVYFSSSFAFFPIFLLIFYYKVHSMSVFYS